MAVPLLPKPEPSGTNRSKEGVQYELKKQIKTINDKISLLDKEIETHHRHLQHTIERKEGGDFVSEALLQSIYKVIDKTNDEIELLKNELVPLVKRIPYQDSSASALPMPKNNWALYERLCTEQQLMDQRLNQATLAYERALNNQSNSVLVQKATDEYLKCHEEYKQINEELFRLGELLNQEQVA